MTDIIKLITDFLNQLFGKKEKKDKGHQVKNLTISKDMPTGGEDGDTWFVLKDGE